MNLTLTKKSSGLIMGLVLATGILPAHAAVSNKAPNVFESKQTSEILDDSASKHEVFNEQHLKPADIGTPMQEIERHLKNFFWGPCNWEQTVDELLKIIKAYEEVLAGHVTRAKLVAIADALTSVKKPGIGKAGLLKVQKVLNAFEAELLMLAPEVCKQVKAMSDMQLYLKVGRKVSA